MRSYYLICLKSFSRVLFLTVILLNVPGCAYFESTDYIELKIPFEPPKNFKLVVNIDTKIGKPPQKRGPHVYVIEFSKNGTAVIDSVTLFNKPHQYRLVTPTRTLKYIDDFTTGGTLEMGTAIAPDGSSYSVEHGAKSVIEIELDPTAVKANPTLKPPIRKSEKTNKSK